MSQEAEVVSPTSSIQTDLTDDTDHQDFFDEYDPQEPSIRLLEIKHLLSLEQTTATTKQDLHAEAKALIIKHNLLAYYKTMCSSAQDLEIVSQLEQNIAKAYAEFDKRIEEANETGVDKDVLDIQLERAQYACSSGDHEKVEEYALPLTDRSMTENDKIDLYLAIAKYYLSIQNYSKYDEVVRTLDPIVEKGGDWDKRNKFLIYQGVNYLIKGDFNEASPIFIQSIPTYASTELIPFDDAISIAVLLAIIRSKRDNFREKVVNSPEVIQTLLTRPLLADFMNAIYKCQYATFYALLPKIHTHLLLYPFLAPHASLYLKEARIVAYSQYLVSFQSVSLPSLAQAFKVSQDFIERDISNLIAAGRLHCRISLVSQVIEVQKPSDKQAQFKELIAKGDKLSGRVNKLIQQLKTT